MQLKGLVRFFTILLIVYSLYQFSFTWFVRNHEKKFEAKARKMLNTKYPDAAKIKNLDQLQDFEKKYYDSLLRHFEDSTKDKTLTYGINGKMSYKRAKSEELNLGLDLQGGMSVTLEVEMTDLLKSLANKSKDPNFLAALQNADSRKANSDADFITLFIEEYRKLEPNRPLAALFAAASAEKIDVKSSDDAVKSYIRTQANEAFETTFDRLSKRIDQFGVAQPNINKNPEKAIINVELPGVKDKERVRANFKSTTNLEFREGENAACRAYGQALEKKL